MAGWKDNAIMTLNGSNTIMSMILVTMFHIGLNIKLLKLLRSELRSLVFFAIAQTLLFKSRLINYEVIVYIM